MLTYSKHVYCTMYSVHAPMIIKDAASIQNLLFEPMNFGAFDYNHNPMVQNYQNQNLIVFFNEYLLYIQF